MPARRPRFAPVDITFTCTACSCRATVSIPWSRHHTLPKGWRSRDVVPTYELPRRTEHIFSCSKACQLELDKLYPPPKKPKWFRYS